MDSLTTFNDNNLIISDCYQVNIHIILIISNLVFWLVIYFVCFKTKSKTELEVKIDKNLTSFIKIFRELKKID